MEFINIFCGCGECFVGLILILALLYLLGKVSGGLSVRDGFVEDKPLSLLALVFFLFVLV